VVIRPFINTHATPRRGISANSTERTSIMVFSGRMACGQNSRPTD